MGVPTGKVIARPLVARACGCVQEFHQLAGDRFRDQRLAKFRGTRCPKCAAVAADELKGETAALPARLEAFRGLPAGAEVRLTRGPGGTWAGALTICGMTAEAEAGGLEAVALALARQWQSRG